MTEVSHRERLPENAYLAAIVLWAVYVLYESARYEDLLTWAFPVVVTLPLVGLCLLKIAYNVTDSDVLGKAMFFDVERGEKAGTLREAIVLGGTIALYLLVVSVLNFFLAMPVFLLAFFSGFGLYSPKRRVLVTVGVWLFICFVFGSVFNVSGVFLGPFSEFDLGLFG